MQSFGWNLLQFARSVDSLQQDIIDGMKEVTSAYFLRKEGLGACYFCVHRTGAMFEGMQALKTVWSSEQNSEAQVVRRFRERGSADSPSLRALSYNEDRSLWVTVNSSVDVKGDATLDSVDAENLIDHWRGRTDELEAPLPPYVRLHDISSRTLVALPLKHHGEKLGVLVVEFDRHIPITSGARQEASLVQEALGRILWLQDAAKSQQDGTRKAFEQLKDIVNQSTSTVDPPTMFFAFPGAADDSVIQTIKQIVATDYHDQLRLVSWDEMASPGQITDQVVKEISRCQYGICYLSQPVVGEPDATELQQYKDNPNVLIEAGMLHALRSSRLASTIAWLPVREGEERSESVPFDFVAERMLQVPRNENSDLSVDEFAVKLKAAIDSMLST